MSLLSLATALASRLPARRSAKVRVERSLSVPMRDGVRLQADRWFAPDLEPGPVVLVRSPYGRGASFSLVARLFAERGLQCVLQSCRGTSGSGGRFDPMRQEQADGLDTLEWTRAQPWFTGQLFTFGGSYLGYTQWAMAGAAGERIDAMALQVTLSNFRNETLAFRWLHPGRSAGVDAVHAGARNAPVAVEPDDEADSEPRGDRQDPRALAAAGARYAGGRHRGLLVAGLGRSRRAERSVVEGDRSFRGRRGHPHSGRHDRRMEGHLPALAGQGLRGHAGQRSRGVAHNRTVGACVTGRSGRKPAPGALAVRCAARRQASAARARSRAPVCPWRRPLEGLRVLAAAGIRAAASVPALHRRALGAPRHRPLPTRPASSTIHATRPRPCTDPG